MLVRKSKISQLLKKEREKERLKCLKDNGKEVFKLKKYFEQEKDKIVKVLKSEHREHLIQKDRKISKLEKEINKNYTKYQKIRAREKHLDQLSDEIENVVDGMVIKVQESLQPFYRTRGKLEAIRRSSNKKHEKVESIFRVVK